jgi:hypothetical protein
MGETAGLLPASYEAGGYWNTAMAAADWGEIWPSESGVGGAWGVKGGICTCSPHYSNTLLVSLETNLSLSQGLFGGLTLLLLPGNSLCLNDSLLVLAPLVLEPHPNDSWIEARQLHQVLLEEGVWSGVTGIHSPEGLELLL